MKKKLIAGRKNALLITKVTWYHDMIASCQKISQVTFIRFFGSTLILSGWTSSTSMSHGAMGLGVVSFSPPMIDRIPAELVLTGEELLNNKEDIVHF